MVIVIHQLWQSKLLKPILKTYITKNNISAMYEFLSTVIIYAAEELKCLTFGLRWRSLGNQAFSQGILNVNIYQTQISPFSIMLTNTVVFPHVVSPLVQSWKLKGLKSRSVLFDAPQGFDFWPRQHCFIPVPIPWPPFHPHLPHYRSAYYEWNRNERDTLWRPAQAIT